MDRPNPWGRPCTRIRSSPPAAGAFRVAAGAFRLRGNAAAARQRIQKLGGHAEITRSCSLDLVTVGPFASRAAADSEAARLKAAGIDVVVADRIASPPAAPISNGPRVVQAGAFREDRNDRQLLGRLQRRGEQPFTVATHDLTLVYVGPFDTRQDAVAASERLRRQRFEGFVRRR